MRLTAGGRCRLWLAAVLVIGATTPLLGAEVPPGEESPLGVRVESGNSAGVTLTHIFFSNDENNLRIADWYCSQHGKIAQFVSKERDRRRYNCVQP